MAAKKSGSKQNHLFSETEELIARLRHDDRMYPVMLWIPDTIGTGTKAKKIAEARVMQWLGVAREVFADCYEGATCFRSHSGIWKDDRGNYHLDQPYIVQTIATKEDIEDEVYLNDLVRLAKRMGKDMTQECILIAVANIRFYISDYSDIPEV
ncbi:MAG: hypothetical protein AAF086_09830 [Planctomycetota bacterium]